MPFGRTAEKMRLSRARVSQLVQRLERRVGAALLTRTSRRIARTSLGQRLRADPKGVAEGRDQGISVVWVGC
ncbi:LysR family transcriptional regulator [Streptomyces sp. NPDC013457]|uniref:LysR family transcriptional regulator n=1 Tax=Streptomyces sp. NPDC013457 TaxID=3364866 RepID=UPI00370214C5